MQVKWTALILMAASISGCGSKESIIPQGEYTVENVYELHAGTNAEGVIRTVPTRPLTAQEGDTDTYLLHNTPRPAFKQLPNPTLFMYVKERLVGEDRTPVPAYITEFKMFERDEYALPGEVGIY